jgi:hypothetical protein
MPVRLRYSIDIAVSSNSNEDKDLGHPVSEVVVDSQGEGGVFKTVLPASATDQEIKLDNIADAKFLAIKTTTVNAQDTLPTISVKKNAIGGEAIDIAPLSGAKEGHFLLTTTGLTALYATNPDASVNVEMTVVMAGD